MVFTPIEGPDTSLPALGRTNHLIVQDRDLTHTLAAMQPQSGQSSSTKAKLPENLRLQNSDEGFPELLCLGVMLNRHVLELSDGVIRELDQLDTAAKASPEPSLYGTFECLLEDFSEQELGGAPRIVYAPSPETTYHLQTFGPYKVHNCNMTALAAIADEIQERLPMEFPELVLPIGLTRSMRMK